MNYTPFQLHFAPLEWSEIRKPSVECRYDNVSASTVFGEIRIEWGGKWRDDPMFWLDVPWFPGNIGLSAVNVKAAKGEAEAYWQRLLVAGLNGKTAL